MASQMPLYGWFGRAVEIDVENRKFEYYEVDEDVLLKYLGGRGYGAYYLYHNMRRGIDPFDPENIIVLASGPLTNTPVPTSGRFSASTKSPLTGGLIDSNCGGHFAPFFKGSRIDFAIIKGMAETPTYLLIDEAKVEFRDASQLWGKDVHETYVALKNKHGRCGVSCIGPAGENLVRFASVIVDGHRAHGRGGLGAVFGSKKIKAVVAIGNTRPAVKDQHKTLIIVKDMLKLIDANPITGKALSLLGTLSTFNIMYRYGVLSTRNFKDPLVEGFEELSAEKYHKLYFHRKFACHNCPVGCGRVSKIDGRIMMGPEFESQFAIGFNLGIYDYRDIVEIHNLCNQLGLDTISMGVTLSCAIELSQEGLIKESLRWGDPQLVKRLIYETSQRAGFGELLAEGSLKLAKSVGHEEYAMQVKGMELPAYDPRASQGMGLAYATSNRGACHLRAYLIGVEILGIPKRVDRTLSAFKAGLCVIQQNLYAAVDSLILCRFIGYATHEEHYSRVLEAVTGRSFSSEDIMEIGERIYNVERLFNVREGIDGRYDTLPKRMLEEPISGGPSQGYITKLYDMLQEYYELRGWDSNGVPRREKIEELKI
ncbi:aldehyde ferredoxin oxidoreductase [Candidatus Bathyarchaeota archaeon ex4484_205]|nr:MAG: aldehyde ferredoxin oxidoreductase [Candidatus Bathyarchaeota archaeon ex4484_205]